jgi:hypothetical protein
VSVSLYFFPEATLLGFFFKSLIPDNWMSEFFRPVPPQAYAPSEMLTHEDSRVTPKGADMHEDIQTRPLISELLFILVARLTLILSFDQKIHHREIPSGMRLAIRNGLLLTFVTKSAARGYDTIPRPCFHDTFRFCSRCENTTRFDSS